MVSMQNMFCMLVVMLMYNNVITYHSKSLLNDRENVIILVQQTKNAN